MLQGLCEVFTSINSLNSHNNCKNSIAVIPFYRSEAVGEEIKPSAEAHCGGSDSKESA